MINPVNTLGNMEYMLYGGTLGANSNCPSYANGYKASTDMMLGNYYNPYMMQQGYNSNPFYNYNNSMFTNPAVVGTTQSGTTQSGATNASKNSTQTSKSDIDKLAKYYEKSNTYVQSWGELGTSAFMIGLTENAQNMKHPLNSFRALRATDKVFNLDNQVIKNLWKHNPELAQNAYTQLHAAERILQPKKSYIQQFFQRAVTDTTSESYKQWQVLKEEMKNALESGDKKKILEATERLKAARGMDGYIPTAWNKVKSFFTGKEVKNLTPMERISNKKASIDAAVKEATEKAATGTTKTLLGSKSVLKQGLKEGKTFALFGLLIDAPKIISAYKNGGMDSALTQTAQTGIKSIADGIGWTIGRAAGTALGTKAGAAIGTAICPGVGTAVGAVLGFLGGAAGSILAGKLTNKLLGTDEATKLEAAAQKKTPEGQAQLLALVAQNQQMGEQIPPDVMQAAERVASKLV